MARSAADADAAEKDAKRVRWCVEIDRSMHAEDAQSPMPATEAANIKGVLAERETLAAVAEQETSASSATASSRPGYLRGTATQRHRKKARPGARTRRGSKSSVAPVDAADAAADATMRRSRTRQSSAGVAEGEGENAAAAPAASSLGKRKTRSTSSLEGEGGLLGGCVS